ncbi:MAG: hypothetical protein QOF78_3336 [Phycisphaerales bacterium]|nr:hypothetical protein [Phycisphaerales bacterium]
MRSDGSNSRVYETFKASADATVLRSGDPARRRRRRPGAACIEGLERRTHLSDASMRIPILVYHTPEVTKTGVDGFDAQMALLHTKGFDSISLEEFRVWRTGGGLPSGVDHPFIAIVDDATLDAVEVGGNPLLGAAEIMNNYGTGARPFRGVTAVPTAQVATAGRMTWAQINNLVAPIASGGFGWDIASHSKNHRWMGDGHPTKPTLPLSQFANSPNGTGANTLYDELVNSKSAIIAQQPSKTNMAFVWPEDDVTVRNLAVAAQTYTIVLGEGSEIGSTTEHFVGLTSGMQNGQLYRINIRASASGSIPATTITTFGQMLDRAFNLTNGGTTFNPHITAYPTLYRARDGTVVADGTINTGTGAANADGITLSGTTVSYGGPAVDYANMQPAYNSAPNPFAGFSAAGWGGNDTVNGSAGADTIDGGDGDDSLNGNDGTDVIAGGLGIDNISGGNQADSLTGAGGNDVIIGGSGNDTLRGENGNDTLNGNGGDDWIYGGLNDDYLKGDIGNDYLEGNDGNDYFDAPDGASYIDTLFGGAGTDTGVWDSVDVVTL